MKVKIERHYNVDVWTNKKADNLRKKECLCLNCLKIGKCPVAKSLFDLCIKANIAMMITRCKNWLDKKPLNKRKSVV